MKLRILLSLVFVLAVSVPVFAQDDAHSKKTQNCAGTISADGQSFTCDKDHKVWKVANPGVLSEMEGHQAKLTFRTTGAPGEIFVTAAVVQRAIAPNPGDSAFRR